MHPLTHLFYGILFTLAGYFAGLSSATGQTDAPHNPRQALDQYRRHALQEKLFVHTDRSCYVVGESVWFKIYSFEGTQHRPLNLSKVVYLEVLNKAGSPVLQTKAALDEGRGNGTLRLPPSLASGHYRVRAYTHWMKNFSPDFYFEKAITLINPFQPPIQEAAPAATAYDVQFFPEGGHLVSELESKVAFRAVGTDGKGLSFKGALINQRNDTVATFAPHKFGIGHFTFTPKDGNEYRALVKDARGRGFTYPLPRIEAHGYTMRVEDSTDQWLRVTVAGRWRDSPNATALPGVLLLAHTRQVVKYTGAQLLREGRATFLIRKDALGEGISHLTVFNDQQRPVCERLYFKRPSQPLIIQAQPDKKAYAPREKISLDLFTHLAADHAAPANLSVSVYLTDGLQPLETATIESYAWLTSDLRGTVESPEYYFSHTDPVASQALDNLMLTHGWRRFSWEEVLKNPARPYPYVPEHGGHFIVGKVVHGSTGAPARGVNAYLATPDKRARLFIARSDSMGRLAFEAKDFFGGQEIIVQTNLNQDSTYRIDIQSPFTEKTSEGASPTFALAKEALQSLLTRSINMQTVNAFAPSLGQVVYASGQDSLAFYGVPDKRYLLDNFTRFPTLEEVMREYVPDVMVRKRQGKFHFWMIDRVHARSLFKEDPLVLLDGVPVFDTDHMLAFDPLKIKKLEVMNSRYFLGLLSFPGVVSYSTYGGDLAGFSLDPRAQVLAYEGLQVPREFYAPRYDAPAGRESRVPDFRNLLYWAPNVTTDAGGKQTLDFYSSDQPGNYAVAVQGITPTGQLGSQVFTLQVRKPL